MNKQFAWSYSRLTAYELCPKRHYHYNVAKDVVEPEGEAMSEGLAVHKALEQRVGQNKPLPLGMGQYEKIAAKLENLPGEIYTEQKLALDDLFQPVGWFASGTWFRTIIDFCVIKNNTAGVIDYKTGKPKPDITQLELMSATILHHMPTVEKVRARLLFLNHNHTEQAEIKRLDLPNIWSRILPRVKKLRRATEETSFPPTPNGLCRKYCAVTSCPHHGVGSI